MDSKSIENEDMEFIQRLGKLNSLVMDNRNDEDYILNIPQFRKLVTAYEFLDEMTERGENGSIEPVRLKPKQEHGGVTANFIVFDLFSDSISRWGEILSCVSAVSIDATLDGKVCISLTIPNVYTRK